MGETLGISLEACEGMEIRSTLSNLRKPLKPEYLMCEKPIDIACAERAKVIICGMLELMMSKVRELQFSYFSTASISQCVRMLLVPHPKEDSG